MILINETTHNTVTGYISADGGEKIFRKWAKEKNWFLRTNFNTGKRFESADSLNIRFKCKNDGRKIINDMDSLNMSWVL